MNHLLGKLLLLFLATQLGFGKEVVNGKKPRGKDMTIQFTEDLRFGAEEDADEYLWALGSSHLAVDGQGHIFIADTKESQILEFDEKGAFLKVLVPKGQGPGEIARLASLQIFTDGHAVALEAGPGSFPKIHFFDKDLKYKDQLAPSGLSVFPVSAYFSPAGDLFAATFLKMDPSSGVMVTKTGILNKEFKPLKEFSSFEQSLDFQNFADPKVLSKFILDLIQGAFRQFGIMTFDDQGYFYSALSDQYTITKWDPEVSKELLVIKREYAPIANTKDHTDAVVDRVLENFRTAPGLAQVINDEFVERIKQKAELPIVKNPIAGMLTMEDGGLLVMHNVNAATRTQTADIFDKEGKFLGQVTLPDNQFLTNSGLPRMVFRNGFAYTMATDEYDDNRVIRYRYRLTKK